MRKQLDPSDSNWTDLAGVGCVRNNVKISLSKATADWGTITHAAICTASTNGSVIAYAEITSPKTIETNDVLEFDINALQVSLD